jgi:hypothetical protein
MIGGEQLHRAGGPAGNRIELAEIERDPRSR